MPRADELRALLARVEGVCCSSPTVDASIYRLHRQAHARAHPLAVPLTCDDEYAPAYTRSVDAAADLVDALLPNWSWEVRRSGFGDRAQASLWDPRVAQVPGAVSLRDHASGVPALALIAALLSALIAREAEHGR